MRILDCTLRDGGYVNDWRFGQDTTRFVLDKLAQSGVDIVECGYLEKDALPVPGRTKYASLTAAENVLPAGIDANVRFAIMVDYGTYPAQLLEDAEKHTIQTIRLCFRKPEWQGALAEAQILQKKGYHVFLQPMATITFSKAELRAFLAAANRLACEAVYMVDSFGVMQKEDVVRLFGLYDALLDAHISIGYHAHNNLQLAYSNARAFSELPTRHKQIVDCSVYGMGRGAGNLNTELFLGFLNREKNAQYRIHPLLEIMDEELTRIHDRFPWGYSVAHYLSAMNGCHPNYANYLAWKNTLTAQSMDEILSRIPEPDKVQYSETLIANLYAGFQQHTIDDTHTQSFLNKMTTGREILLVAPGKSIEEEAARLQTFIEKKRPYVISVNHLPANIRPDLVFISNQKRYKRLTDPYSNQQPLAGIPLLLTSNLRREKEPEHAVIYPVNYSTYLSNQNEIMDNAGLMLIRLLVRIGCPKAFLAGFDGYTPDGDNYFDERMRLPESHHNLARRDALVGQAVEALSHEILLQFVTKSRYPLYSKNPPAG